MLLGLLAGSTLARGSPLKGVAMTVLNIAGSQMVARAQTVIVFIVIGILVLFSVVTLANMNGALLAPSG